MRIDLLILAGLLTPLGYFPYIADTIKNKTHPNLVTWFTWTLIAVINTAAAISTHSTHTAVFSGITTIGNGAILIAALKHGVKKYTLFDFICQALALLGVVLWRLTSSPSLAVLFCVLVIAIAALPTWRHAFLRPFEETWQGFVIGSTSGFVTIASLSSFTFVSVAFPLTASINSALMVCIIVSRRRRMAEVVPVQS
jgi:hypothetical protein